MKDIKDIIHHYVGTELKVLVNNYHIEEFVGINVIGKETIPIRTVGKNGVDEYRHEYVEIKPIFHSLEDLDKEIVVPNYNGGEKFRAVEEIELIFPTYNIDQLVEDNRWINQTEFMIVELLISWHFCPWQYELHEGSWIRKEVNNG